MNFHCVNKDIGKKIKKIRESKNMNTKNLADAVGILDTSLSKIERIGTNNVETLKKIAEALDVRVSDFFEENSYVFEPEIKMDHVTKDDLAKSNREIIKILRSEINQLREELSLKKDSYKPKAETRKKKS
ncbi:helix-turn-helix domain-containing protein [Aurantibacillus circumpalustris]|uniref:helix-turn-helix domain-containing protein n=1 Tax=Aurantibacillus circumpalustris TaxID=3036359 RepID=UPI00295B8724|nr:helix-turn-helix transcriptional regulator [Aurantibacillus circumpalustris]